MKIISINGEDVMPPLTPPAWKPGQDLFDKCAAYDEPDRARALGIYPFFRPIEEMDGAEVLCEGKRVIMVGSNNYLGLANDQRVVDAAIEATRKYGLGCTGSRFLSGNLIIHEHLEEALADYIGKDAALLFSTGYFANQGALTSLFEDGDYILCDKENHASLIDGCRMSAAKIVPFAHNSPESLHRRLARLPKEAGKMVVIDGVFSMSGDIARLPELIAVAEEFGAKFYVDEAHALGVIGPDGKGSAYHHGVASRSDLIMGTFSKSLGCMGGFLAGDEDVIKYVRHKARCFIFTASPTPAVAGGVLKALEVMREEQWRIVKLWENTRRMHKGFRSLGFHIGTTETPIVPILVGDEQKAFFFAQRLFDNGIFATPAIYPAVRRGQAIIRTSYMATHTPQQLDYVLETFERIARELCIFEDDAYQRAAGEIPQRHHDSPLPNPVRTAAV
ncbi:MAG: aminotransferase class I/II-fold pyridoxal phosphate-dependent enzyme [Chthoniobacterales bacterium]|jgi:8-amino-7-oxononanoate synthase|nr:aminotransferase class I/II-fold pyridoxal phosphate-dependent enzyme [Chthoniobacterales bacterium]